MNIFAMSENPTQCALWLDDVRKNKMIVESAQLLSTSMNVLSPSHKFDVYKTTHINHPCAVWVRDSRSNFKWLLDHLNALLEQWGTHKTGGLVPAFTTFYELGRFGREVADAVATGLCGCLGAGLSMRVSKRSGATPLKYDQFQPDLNLEGLFR